MAVDFFLAIGMTTQAETILQPYPVPNKAELKELNSKLTPAPAVSPVRSRRWIGASIFSFLCLLLLGAGALGLTSFLPMLGPAEPTAAPTAAVPTEEFLIPVSSELPTADGMVDVAANTYELGISPGDKYHEESRTLALDRFWIDKYPITNAQYEQYILETGSPAPAIWPGQGDHPVRGVTWEQAIDYCGWMNKRLPTEAEWEAAGRGAGAAPQLYPWGNDASADGQALRLPDQDTYAVGSQSFNQSPFGVFDMVGNIWEWVGEPYAGGQNIRILRGGRFGLPVNDLAYRLTIAPDDTHYVQYAGFRCVAEEVR
jgi:serine/threonine-protein kinase